MAAVKLVRDGSGDSPVVLDESFPPQAVLMAVDNPGVGWHTYEIYLEDGYWALGRSIVALVTKK